MLQNPDFATCVTAARHKLQDLFHNTIAQLLHNFPADYLTKDGRPFWSGPKRAPSILNFDSNDEFHAKFVFTAANLYAFNLGLAPNTNLSEVLSIANSVQVAPFAPKQMHIAAEEGE